MSSSFSPTPAELAIVNSIFASADPQKLGIITGDVAVRVFTGAKLPSTVLGEIWNIADEDNKGWLPKRGVAIAVRLIGHAQKGEKVSTALLAKPGPLAVIDGVTVVSQQNTGMSAPKSPPPGFSPLSSQDKTKFHNWFLKAGPANGLLSGEKSRDIFVKSKLSNDKLLQIWNLADTQNRGALDSTDFAIGMYFIQGLMSGQITFIPSSLPPGLYQQAGGSTASNQGSVRSHMTGTSGSFSPVAANFSQRSQLQPQLTGQSQRLQSDYTGMSAQSRVPALPARPSIPSTIGSSAFGTRSNGLGAQWDVTASEKASADQYFDTLDTQKRGYIEGDVAVPFMLESKLPGEVLAQVWDLADINNDGRLTKDGFAVAVHLIQKKLSGAEIPMTLPPSLVPPSMRTNGASPFSPASAQSSSEPPQDLFSFDDTPPPSAVSPQHTGRFQPQQTGHSHHDLGSSTTLRAPAQDPFESSGFHSSHQDLMGDDDAPHTTSPPLQDQSAEIGNTKNQLNSTNRSLQSTATERVVMEQTLSNQASELANLQTQLASAKAAYETEIKLLTALKERHSSQAADIQKSREELIRAESDLSAVRVEKAEVEGSFLRDKEEARDLHRRMVETSQQVEAVKLEIEKAKKEAKQQKGLLAIARKQLSTKEAEKAKMQKELEDANLEATSLTNEREQVEAQLAEDISAPTPAYPERALTSDSLGFAASQPLPATPDLSAAVSASPASGKSNNPFERLAMGSGNSTPLPQSPFLPFAGASIPSPPVAANGTVSEKAAEVDIFGFDEPEEKPFVKDEPTQDVHDNIQAPVSESVPASVSRVLPAPLDSVLSPSETEYFVTPPQTAEGRSHATSPVPVSQDPKPAEQYLSLNDVAANFPAIENMSPPPEPSIAKEAEGHHQTDLEAKLQELDIDESDSDSDDEVPLATLAASANKESKRAVAPVAQTSNGVFDNVFGISSPAPTPAPAPAPSQNNDDGSSNQVENLKSSSPFESPSAQFIAQTTDAPIIPPTAEPAVGGVNAFDEAMGKIPAAPSSTQFTFDSAFEDNFDFSTAAEAPTVVAPTIAPVMEASTQNGSHNNLNFDDIFSTSASDNTTHSTPAPPIGLASSTNVAEPTSAVKQGSSLEESFSGFDVGPSLELDKSFSSSTQPSPLKRAASPVQKPFPAAQASNSPRPSAPSPRGSNARSFSPPPRAVSPPPRNASPKPRVSSSSSKEAHEKVKEHSTRHSKLSIRLPFGKKKKAPPSPPPSLPSQLLTPPQEVPSRTVSPAVEDDVEPVKQLTAMGFSRSQAVDALEKYGYNVQQALNSLLGSQ